MAGHDGAGKNPRPIIDKLSREVARTLRTPDVRDNLLMMGADPFIGSADEFAALIKADWVKYAKLIRDAKIRLD